MRVDLNRKMMYYLLYMYKNPKWDGMSKEM